ncbi:MAG TPA: DcaP family trimeric outer membrane transporter [Terriglobales bacterium]|nr:DcaP family trimeric outer membrane transporter [Terriglobales bacterium]
MRDLTAGCLAAIWVLAVITPAVVAQEASSGQNVQDLHEQVNRLEEQLKNVQARLAELESAQPAPGTQVPPPGEAAKTQASQPSLQGQTSAQVGVATQTYTTFTEDSSAAPRFDNIPLDPKYNGFFRLPGTQTILKIGGYFKTDFIYDLKPPGNIDAFIPASFPVPQIATVNNAEVSVRPTRMSLDFRIPSTKIGEVRFYLEGDFFGTNSTTPRLRHAYAQAENFLIGQTFTNFMDPDGFPDTLDFQGPNGMVNLRNPQLRYGFALGPSTTLYFSAEKPSSSILFTTPMFTSQPSSPAPDGAVRLRKEFQSGHFQVASIFRDLADYVTSGTEAKTGTVFGWGVNISSGFRIFGKDNVILAAVGGHGISRYIQDPSGLGIDAEVTGVPTNPHLEATPNAGVDASYQHYWTKTLRSSLVYSYAGVHNAPISAFVPATTYNHGNYGAVNIIWNPFQSSLNVGAEVLYGWQEVADGNKASDTRFQFSAKYNFVKLAEKLAASK